MLVLLQAARRSERLVALLARVRARADVRRPDVTLQVARVREDLLAVLAREVLVVVEARRRQLPLRDERTVPVEHLQ